MKSNPTCVVSSLVQMKIGMALKRCDLYRYAQNSRLRFLFIDH